MSESEEGNVGRKLECRAASQASDPVCALFEGLDEVGTNISSELEGMILTGIFLATQVFVGIGIWLGGVVGRGWNGP